MGIGDARGLAGIADEELQFRVIQTTLPRLLANARQSLGVMGAQGLQMVTHSADRPARQSRQFPRGHAAL